MGCGASKATSVAPSDSNQPTARNNNNKNHSTTHVSPLSSGNISDDDISISAVASQGLAFEVPLKDDSDDSNSSSLIKKHPPKRLQRLEDQQVTPLTHELLDEKQAEAEQRRQQRKKDSKTSDEVEVKPIKEKKEGKLLAKDANATHIVSDGNQDVLTNNSINTEAVAQNKSVTEGRNKVTNKMEPSGEDEKSGLPK